MQVISKKVYATVVRSCCDEVEVELKEGDTTYQVVYSKERDILPGVIVHPGDLIEITISAMVIPETKVKS